MGYPETLIVKFEELIKEVMVETQIDSEEELLLTAVMFYRNAHRLLKTLKTETLESVIDGNNP